MKPSIWPAGNSGLAQLGFEANFKVGFVLGSWFLNRYIWLIKSPTDAKPRDVVGNFTKKQPKKKTIKNEVFRKKWLPRSKNRIR